MIELPTVKPCLEKYSKDDLEKIFSKFDLTMMPPELITIRINQILNHPYRNFLIETLDNITNLIGQPDNSLTEAKFEYNNDRLIALHSQVLLEIKAVPDCVGVWVDWTLLKVYEHYFNLAMEKGWENFYISEGNRTFKKYQVLDMLNDLVVNKYRINGYVSCSFMSDFKEEALDDMSLDDIITVSLRGDSG